LTEAWEYCGHTELAAGGQQHHSGYFGQGQTYIIGRIQVRRENPKDNAEESRRTGRNEQGYRATGEVVRRTWRRLLIGDHRSWD
jgi:hypothetical protein